MRKPLANLDDPALPEMTRQGTAVFEDAIRMLADALGVELDEVNCEAEYAVTTEDVVMRPCQGMSVRSMSSSPTRRRQGAAVEAGPGSRRRALASTSRRFCGQRDRENLSAQHC